MVHPQPGSRPRRGGAALRAAAALALILIPALARPPAPSRAGPQAGGSGGLRTGPPLRLLFYYGYPSMINGASGNLTAAASEFSRYDVVVLGAGLEEPSHPEHSAAEFVMAESDAAFFGYVDLSAPIGEVCSRISAWAGMGADGVFLDRAGFDFLGPEFGGPAGAREHQLEAVLCARDLGLRVAVNSWDPDDVFSPAGGEPPLPLGQADAALIEDAVYGGGEARPEYLDHLAEYSERRAPGGPALWCLVTTAASSPHENRVVGYDALTRAWSVCDAVAIQEDLGEDSSVFYPFAEPGGSGKWEKIRGLTVAVYGSGDLSDGEWVDAVLDFARDECLDSVALAVYWVMDDLRSSSVHPDPSVTPPDGDVRDFIRRAHARGLRVVLKPSLYVLTGDWVALADPADPDAWFDGYSDFILGYASLAQEEGVEFLILETELSSLVGDPRWVDLVGRVREIYGGLIGYAQPQGSPSDPSEILPSMAEVVDFVGVDAYYPLNGSGDYRRAWDEIHASRILPLRFLLGKPVVFTEIGYRNVEGADSAPWDFESPGPRDDGLQAELWRAFLEEEEPRIDGFLYWAETRDEWLVGGDVGYSLMGKPASAVLRRGLCRPSGLDSVEEEAPLTAVIGSDADLAAAYAASRLTSGVVRLGGGGRVRLPRGPLLVLGGPEANPAAAILNPYLGVVVGLDGSSGILGFGNSTIRFEVDFGRRDAAVLAVGEVNGTAVFLAEGLTRFGTEAAAACLASPSCRPRGKASLVFWEDVDGDGSVSPGELEAALPAGPWGGGVRP